MNDRFRLVEASGSEFIVGTGQCERRIGRGKSGRVARRCYLVLRATESLAGQSVYCLLPALERSAGRCSLRSPTSRSVN